MDMQVTPDQCGDELDVRFMISQRKIHALFLDAIECMFR